MSNAAYASTAVHPLFHCDLGRWQHLSAKYRKKTADAAAPSSATRFHGEPTGHGSVMGEIWSPLKSLTLLPRRGAARARRPPLREMALAPLQQPASSAVSNTNGSWIFESLDRRAYLAVQYVLLYMSAVGGYPSSACVQ